MCVSEWHAFYYTSVSLHINALFAGLGTKTIVSTILTANGDKQSTV